MADFSCNGRKYNVSSLILDGEPDRLTITNQEGVQLIVRSGEKTALRKNSKGVSEEVNLQSLQYKDFYDDLLKTAYKAVQNELEEDAKNFFKKFNVQYEKHVQDFQKTLNIVVIGNVSSGKSSLINALLRRERQNPITEVGVTAGVTTELNVLRLDEKVRLIDSPGLGDVIADRSAITQDFLKNIDVGILVVSGAVDASQKVFFDDLKKACNSVFVVLSKLDDWDKFKPEALEAVMNQWKECLRIEKIYPVCTLGYDPQLSLSIPLDIRGVECLREDIEHFLELQGKKLLLARHMSQKRPYALGIIASSITLVGVEAALPGKALFITTTQATAIISLYYLYTGKIISSGAILSLLPVFAGQAVATNVFLFFTSFIPPTGIIEVAAAVTAISITTAMLASVNFMLAKGIELTNKEALKLKFKEYRATVDALLKEIALTDLSKLRSLNFKDMIDKVI